MGASPGLSKPKPCIVEGCDLPKALPKHRCIWHALMGEPIDVQVAAAHTRREAVPEVARLARLDASAWPPGTRWCAGCQTLAPRFYFPPNGTQCRACTSAADHSAMVKREYDLTGEEYAALLAYQGGVCAICRQRSNDRRLAVDHDHRTGEVLGLLCKRCNNDLKGSAWDSLDLARALVNYMEHPPLKGEWTPMDPRKTKARFTSDRANEDPSYLMYDHDPVAAPLPSILDGVVKRMTVDQLVFSGGRSDPETGVYWLAYRRQVDEDAPFDMRKAPAAEE